MRLTSFLGALLLAAAPLTACSSYEPPANAASCGVLVDASGFRDHEAATLLVKKNLGKFLGGCKWAAFTAVSGRSVGNICVRTPLSLYATKAENPNGNAETARRFHTFQLQKAGEATEYLLLKCKDTVPGSDILGAFTALTEQFALAPDRAAPRRMIVFSDLVHRTERLTLPTPDMNTPEGRKTLIDGLAADNLLPALDGTEVTVHGVNLGSIRDPAVVAHLLELWKGIFAASGAGSTTLS